MKNFFKTFWVAFLLILGCQKENTKQTIQNTKRQLQENLSLVDAKNFIKNQTSKDLKGISILKLNWSKTNRQLTSEGTVWESPIPGQPIFENYKQGFRKLVIFRDLKTKKITARILEIIPESVYLQKSQFQNVKFYGRLFEYDLNYRLIGGKIFADGNVIGEIRQLTKQEIIENANNILSGAVKSIKHDRNQRFAQASGSCIWSQSYYIDGEGDFIVHASRICSGGIFQKSFYQDFGMGGNATSLSGGGGGGGSSGSHNNLPAPAPSNLPGENNAKVDPKKLMDCFSKISSTNASFVLRIYVVEPFPGTSFNVGPNSFGHVAISLTKTNASTSITQTVGFYPTGNGLEKLNSNSQILENGDIHYDMSATYFIAGASFQKVIDYISSPPSNYDFTEFNCSAFVYAAGQAGGVPIPDPTTQIGLGGPGGAGFAKTPAGMASALRDEKAKNLNADVSEDGGRIPPSKGPCN